MSTLTTQMNHDEAPGSLAGLPSIVRFLFVPIRGRLSREQNPHSARALKTDARLILEDAVRSTGEHLGLHWLTGAKVRIWYGNHGAKELRLLSHV